jgi:hypothetical protein
MTTKAPARVQTNLVGRIITKADSVPVGSYRWPVDDPIEYALVSFPAEHKAEIVAVFTDNDGELKLTCRTPVKGLLFTIPATDNGHSVSYR